jgi:hypothetical protein
VETLQKELAQFKADAAPVIVQTAQRLNTVAENHNKVVAGVQTSFSQAAYEMSLVGRTLRNVYGKDKWEGMVEKARKEFVAEAEKAAAEQAKAEKEAAEKAAKDKK